MKSKNIDIRTNDGTCDAFIASPGDQVQLPAVILFMDAFGLRPYLEEMAQTLAARGYFVLVPNLLYRIKRSPLLDLKYPLKAEQMPEIHKDLMPLVKAFDPAKGLDDVNFFLKFLSEQKQVKPGKIGITGYCMGGSFAIRTAARYPQQIAAAASFHAGNLATDAADSPHKLAPQIKARLYLGHADNDKSMPEDQIKRFSEALDEAGVHYKAEKYEGAAHGYSMKDLPAYNERALERHWTNLFNLLGQSI